MACASPCHVAERASCRHASTDSFVVRHRSTCSAETVRSPGWKCRRWIAGTEQATDLNRPAEWRLQRFVFRLGLGACLLTAFSSASGVEARAQVGGHAEHAMGTVSFPVSCSASGQVAFNHAVALLHHMAYAQARTAFQALAQADPTCAMAWGIAMTLFQPPWPTRPGPEQLRFGWDEVQRAKALDPPTAK
jgi:hypothetical protein